MNESRLLTGPPRAGRIGLTLTGLGIALFATMWHRRPDQFTHPYIWVEDGTRNLPDFIAHGWAFVFEPIVGYISIPIRVLLAIGASLSFRWLPEITFALALIFTYLVLAAIALSPTTLRYRFLCAIALLVLPTNPEVYGVSLYVGWWGSVLVLLPLLWPTRSDDQIPLRATLLTIGGLSTPLVVGVLPLYGVRWLLWRTRSDRWLLVLGCVISAVQIATMWTMEASLGGTPPAQPLVTVPQKFFGYYLLWTGLRPAPSLYFVLGMGLLGMLVVSAVVRRRTLDWTFVVLVACLFVSIVLATLRAPLDVMHPTLAGGRYFFLPYLLLSWLLLFMIDSRHQGTTVFCVAALVAALSGFAVHGRWHHVPGNWRAHVEQCLAMPMHQFPVYYEGTQPHRIIWAVDLPGEACRTLVSGSLFDNNVEDGKAQASP
jgi:hypothetical protein